MTIVNKSDLIDLISESTGGTKADAQRNLDALISVIEDCLRADKEVKIPGFATFRTQHRPARKGRNPQTGAELHIPASITCNVKAGSRLKAAAAESKE